MAYEPTYKFHTWCEIGLEDYIIKNRGITVSGKNGRRFISGTVTRRESRFTTSNCKCDLVFVADDGIKYYIEVVNTNEISDKKRAEYLDNNLNCLIFYVKDIGSYLSNTEARKAARKSAKIYGLVELF